MKCPHTRNILFLFSHKKEKEKRKKTRENNIPNNCFIYDEKITYEETYN